MRYFLTCFTFVLFAIFCVSFATPVLAATAKCPEGEVYSNLSKECVKEFIPLVGIPYVDTTDANLSLPGYVDALYKAAISIAAFMAVVKIIFAGVKYMLSDVVTSKEDAKKDIRGALIGLLIVVGAVLILNTINPQLKELTALGGPPGLDLRLKTYDDSDPIYKYRDICDSTSSLSCKEWCDSKDGEYTFGAATCSHNQDPPTTEDVNDTSLTGEDVLITGGKAQIDQAIEDSGKTPIFQDGLYASRPDHAHRITRLRNCEEEGGTSYQIFATSLTYTGGAELFVCYK